MSMKILTRTLAVLSLLLLAGLSARVEGQTTPASTPPSIVSMSYPQGGDTQILFHGKNGPFRLQTRAAIDPASPWVDLPNVKITELEPGVYLATLPKEKQDAGYYRIASDTDASPELKGWAVRLQVSTPANGKFFVKGERPVVTVTILDNFAQGVTPADLSALALYMAGPQEPTKTVSAVKLLNATTDRTKPVHHYINLKTQADAVVSGPVTTYTLQPVTDEEPGTYNISLRAALGADGIQQVMRIVDVQIGTEVVEKDIVAKANCATCHLGAVSGKMYLHHTDVGFSPTGNWSLDMEPVKSCKACHNNNGYAAYTDASATGGKVTDHIVRRVHGVHMGADLTSDFNTNQVTGDFRDYTKLEFPADKRNCTACHVDDRWQTEISRLACGSCHDNTWFGAKASKPATMVAHAGGPAADDKSCAICHATEGGIVATVKEAHKIPADAMGKMDITLSPPANGKFYVAGEKPVVTVVIKDDAGKAPIDHTKVNDVNFSTASLFVYGPRAQAVPVLTSTAKNVNSKLRASISSSKAGPWDINGKVWKIAVNGSAPQNITITGATNLVTAAEFAASVNAVITNLNGGAKATASGTTGVSIKTLIQGANARFEVYNGDVTTAMGWKRGPNTTMEPDVTIAAGFTPSNDLRALSDPLDYLDPQVTRGTNAITYQLDDVAGLGAGTYHAYAYILPKTNKVAGLNLVAIGFAEFQVGSTNVEKKIATNCSDCHKDTIFHLTSGPQHPAPFDVDYCVACHDYGHNAPGEMFKNQGGTSLNGWSGFGAMPIVRRVHGVHFAHYLEHSEEIYANATKDTFGAIIFPQDVRNCTKCHSDRDEWKQQPSRLACLACHDSDAAKAHGKIMTFMGDPADPFGPKSVETCDICHGAGAEFSPDKVHRITNPFVPPYPREPKE